MIRCSVCKSQLIDNNKIYDWLQLNNYIECLFNERIIEGQTMMKMLDLLQTFKTYAFDEELSSRKEIMFEKLLKLAALTETERLDTFDIDLDDIKNYLEEID
jgi:hypothetical protein